MSVCRAFAQFLLCFDLAMLSRWRTKSASSLVCHPLARMRSRHVRGDRVVRQLLAGDCRSGAGTSNDKVPISGRTRCASTSTLTDAKEHQDEATGMAKFLGRVYASTGLGIGGGLVTAQGFAASGVAEAFAWPCMGAGIVMSFGGIWGINRWRSMTVPVSISARNRGVKVLKSTNSPARLASFGSLSLGMGLTLAPMVDMISTTVSPSILPVASVLALSSMGASSLYAIWQPTDSLLHWRAPLIGGLGGLIAVGVGAIASQMLLGPQHPMGSMLHSVDTYGGILLFTAMNAYDTQLAMARYRDGDADHLGCATDLFLNFMNLLIRIMEALAKAQEHNKR
jgi:FtsH-binding integral membrane protein